MAGSTPDHPTRAARARLIVDAGFELPLPAAEDLALDLRARHLDAGDFLFHEGDPGTTLFVVESGTVEAVTTSRDGRELIFRSMGRGSMIGELTIIDGTARSAGVRATEPSLVVGISRRALLDHAHRRPEVGLALARLCARRALDLSQWATRSSFASLESRLSSTLLALLAAVTDTTGGAQDAPRIQITQQALADRLGVSRESINKWLRWWQREGLVRLARGSITVADPKRLEAITLS